jgi:hypothetical protein
VDTNGVNYSVLYRFNGEGDGEIPMAGLFTSGNGIFYGTALEGGNTNAGFGTVFRFAIVPTLNLVVSNPSAPALTLTGLANQSCQLQVSSNLMDWNFLTDVTITNGSTQVIDTNAMNAAARYYRAVIP